MSLQVNGKEETETFCDAKETNDSNFDEDINEVF